MSRRLLSWPLALVGLFAITLSGDHVPKPPEARLADSSARSIESQHGVDRGSINAAATAGRRAFVDPKTGKLVSHRQGAAPPNSLPVEAPLSTSGEGLREVPGRTRGGGIKLHLEGRFSSTVTARAGPDGNLTIRCRGDANPD